MKKYSATTKALFVFTLLCALSGCSTTDIKLMVANNVAKLGDYTVARSVSYGNLDTHVLDI